MIKKRTVLDEGLVILSLSLLTVPVLLFLIFWTKPAVALTGAVLLAVFFASALRDLRRAFTLSVADAPLFWLAAFSVVCLWCFLSGSGNFAPYSMDQMVRLPMYRDLCREAWPVTFDPANQSAAAQELLGSSGQCRLTYYFTWYLPPALISRTLRLSEPGADLVLVWYQCLCAFTVFYCLENVLKRISRTSLFVLIFFGGLDSLISCWNNFVLGKDFVPDWWTCYFSYSSNTTQMNNIPHACLSVWLIVCLLCLMVDRRNMAALSALSVAFNPFATVAMVPIAVCACFNSGTDSIPTRLRQMFHLPGVLLCGYLAAVFGSFYIQTAAQIKPGRGYFLFAFGPAKEASLHLLVFLFTEVIVFYLVMGNRVKEKRFWAVTGAILCVIPLFRVGQYNDLALKSSIPALFLLMILLLQSYQELPRGKRKAVLASVVLLGCITALGIWRRQFFGLSDFYRDQYICRTFHSFSHLEYFDPEQERLFILQYLTSQEGSLWVKFFAR